MDGTEEVQNLENVCRLCLAADDAKSSIFGTPSSTTSLADKIEAYLSIQVSTNDRVSTFICSECVGKVNRWHSYRESCQRSQEKLQQWLLKQTSTNQTIQIKDEPVDIDDTDNIEILMTPEDKHGDEEKNDNIETNGDISSNGNNATKDPIEESTLPRVTRPNETANIRDNSALDRISVEDIKAEPVSDDDSDSYMDVDSASESAYLVLNPMASNRAKDDCRMEADSTQKFHGISYKVKRKGRRTKTHYQGKKVYKRKCNQCLIYLHSKNSYEKHMERFHNIITNAISLDSKPRTLQRGPGVITKVGRKKNVLPVRMSARIAEAALQQLENENENESISENGEHNKEANLTAMQLDIISQLKTYSCYSCEESFIDRRSTLNHIRQHVPNLRPYTCIACLTEFNERSEYKMHCSESYDCALKIAHVIPKYGTERYFTCNMCLEPMSNRQELLNHLTEHAGKSDNSEAPLSQGSFIPLQQAKRQAVSPTDIPNPYMGGDPQHNHKCDLCGMIYKHKINMQKHHDHCATLAPHARVSYRCVHCGLTFLIFKKFQSHLTVDHRRREFNCHLCSHVSHSSNDFLAHYDSHRGIEEDPSPTSSVTSGEDNAKAYNCALCGENFNDLADYTEHRNLHLKVKIYSCVICRSMFSSAQTLESHMRDHGILDQGQQNAHHSFNEDHSESMDNNIADVSSVSDPGGRLPTCPECGNSFANTNNVARHLKNVHRIERSICNQCYEVFVTKEQLQNHLKVSHLGKSPVKIIPPKVVQQKPVLQCPQCFKVYTYESALHHHCQNVHGFNYDDRTRHVKPVYKCEICSKTFKEAFSMRIHKTWHYRADSRLARGMPNSKLSPVKVGTNSEPTPPANDAPKPAKAKKSFPNAPKYPSMKSQDIECQVCRCKFDEVTELRKHLWEVHCGRSKQEKPFIVNELQCELCTTIFEDRASLDEHMAWHRDNPILSNNMSPQVIIRENPVPEPTPTFSCSTCGKVCSSKKMLYKHKRAHKVGMLSSKLHSSQLKKMVTCGTCSKVFTTTGNLSKHRAMTGCGLNYNVKMKKESGSSEVEVPRKKPVHCLLCKAVFPSMRVLYQHKQMMHNKNKTANPVKPQGPVPSLVALTDNQGGVICNICGKRFNSVPALKQHYTIKHKAQNKGYKAPRTAKGGSFICMTKNCRQEFPDQDSLSQHEIENHSNILYSCQMCERHFFDKSIIVKHVQNTHKAAYQVGVTNTNDFFEEVDLNTYDIKNLSNPRECPVCHVRYPNTKALKIHYYKFHDKDF